MKSLSQEITDILITNKYITPEKRESYIYCYTYIIENMKYDLITLLVGLLLHKFKMTLIYILLFNIFRSFCGGYHAKTPIMCNIMSYLTSILFFGTSMILNIISPSYLIILFVVSSLAIIYFSPLDCTTKKYNTPQRKLCKKLVISTCSMATIAFIFSMSRNKIHYCYALTFCVMVISISLITQKIVSQKRNLQW